MASKQRRPGSALAEEGRRPEAAPPSLSMGPEHEGRAPAVTPPVPDRLGQAGRSISERVALALCVAPRAAADTARLIEVVGRSALPEPRKSDIRDRLLGDQAAADQVAAAVVRAFGRDDGALRAALIEGARRATDQDLAEVVAAHTGEAEASVRSLCDDLAGWVGWWWDEEEGEDLPPGDYAAEESGA